jgi:hypothetical protein
MASLRAGRTAPNETKTLPESRVWLRRKHMQVHEWNYPGESWEVMVPQKPR